MHHVSVSQAMGKSPRADFESDRPCRNNPEFLIDREIDRVASQLQLGMANIRDCALNRKSWSKTECVFEPPDLLELNMRSIMPYAICGVINDRDEKSIFISVGQRVRTRRLPR